MNFAKFLKKPLLQNTSGRRLLYLSRMMVPVQKQVEGDINVSRNMVLLTDDLVTQNVGVLGLFLINFCTIYVFISFLVTLFRVGSLSVAYLAVANLVRLVISVRCYISAGSQYLDRLLTLCCIAGGHKKNRPIVLLTSSLFFDLL